MSELIQVFSERQEDWVSAIGTHLQISLVALCLAIMIALPLSILISQHRKLAEWVLQVAGIFQTIPSLAILGLLIPFMGIGALPAVTALVIYAVFPILQNTVTGLNEIDPMLDEAATAFGMTKWEKLKKYELALAMPIIISGVRTSAVMIIGTATLAALIGAGGLGSFILLGIDRNNASLIVIGAVSSALLAIIVSMGIRFLEHRRLKHIIWSFAVIVMLTCVSFVQMSGMMQRPLVIAGKLGVEPDIIIHMYEELIEHYTDLEVEVKPNFGKTTFLYEALKSGAIDIYPEFTGTLVSSLLEAPPAVSNDPLQTYEAARDGIYAQDQLILLAPMNFQNTYAIAVKRSYAEQHQLARISDLTKVQQQAKAGFTLEFNDREDGNLGLQRVYGLHLDVVTMEPSLRYQAIQNDAIQITEAYSTDSELKVHDLVVLEDDRQLFPVYQGAPLLRSETLKQYPELKPVLERLANRITTEQMSEMNYQVEVMNDSAEQVAHNFLIEQGLLE